MTTFISAFLLSIGLFFGIGAQSTFVIKKAIKGEHVFLICFVCFTADILLILAGVSGSFFLLTKFSWLSVAIKWCGVTFLVAYAMHSFWGAFKKNKLVLRSDVKSSSIFRSILTALAFTYFNPHIYLDMLLISSVALQFKSTIVYFLLGTVFAALVFYIILGYGASLLRPLFNKPKIWQILDFVIGVFMLGLAVFFSFS